MGLMKLPKEQHQLPDSLDSLFFCDDAALFTVSRRKERVEPLTTLASKDFLWCLGKMPQTAYRALIDTKIYYISHVTDDA